MPSLLVPSSPPLNVESISSSFDEIQLRWEAIPPDEVNGILLYYKIRYRLTGSSSWKRITVPPFVLETSIPNLSENAVHEIKMSGYNSKGDGPLSPWLTVKTTGRVDIDCLKLNRHQSKLHTRTCTVSGDSRKIPLGRKNTEVLIVLVPVRL